MTTIQAIYENGVFRPLGPVDLPEGSSVRVVVEPAAVDQRRSPPWGEGLRRSAGSLAGIPGVDEDIEQILRQRGETSYRDFNE